MWQKIYYEKFQKQVDALLDTHYDSGVTEDELRDLLIVVRDEDFVNENFPEFVKPSKTERDRFVANENLKPYLKKMEKQVDALKDTHYHSGVNVYELRDLLIVVRDEDFVNENFPEFVKEEVEKKLNKYLIEHYGLKSFYVKVYKKDKVCLF